jgi:hypothetical protein
MNAELFINTLLFTSESSFKAMLPTSFIVVHTFVTVRNGHFSFRVANIGQDDIWITPRTRVGIMLKGDIETSDKGKIEVLFHL